MKYLYVITGGTLVHVSPHFALCAPAYGHVGETIEAQVHTAIATARAGEMLRACLIRTRLAGPNSADTLARLRRLGVADAPETNADVRTLVKAIVRDPEAAALVMAAAICDFEPVALTAVADGRSEIRGVFGKAQPRLHHVDRLSLELEPSAKIIDEVKRARPDLVLATFKTTAGVSTDEMVAQARHNLARSESDFVFANDVHHRTNCVVALDGGVLRGRERDEALRHLAGAIVEQVLGRAPNASTQTPD